MKSKHLLLPLLLLLILPIITSIDFNPNGNIQGFNRYSIYNFSEINATKFYSNGTLLVDTTISNCSTDTSCSNVLYKSELNTISELNTQISDATILISGGTLTNSKWCIIG